MALRRRAWLAAFAAALWTIVPAAQAQAPAPAAQAAAPAAVAPPFSDAVKEAFLAKARIVSMTKLGVGTTNSRRATLSDGTLTHDAHIQIVDEQKTDRAARTADKTFLDSYRYNIAAYRLARLVGLRHVPPSVERSVDGSRAAVTWWVDDVLMDEEERREKNTSGPDAVRTGRQIRAMHIWDELIHNTDRNQGNVIWTKDWTLWLIDHTRSFQPIDALMKPQEVVACEASLLERMRGLTEANIATAVGNTLTRLEIQATLKRRDRIVRQLDALIAKEGEAAVIFTLP
jgi:hypothetical protein